MSLKAERVAMVTGAGSGIGKATAIALARAGLSVVLAGRQAGPLERVADDVRELGRSALPVCMDVGDADSVSSVFARIKQTFGRLDVLFNNAGIGSFSVPLEELDRRDWKRVLDTNLSGTFLCCQAAFKLMKEQVPQGGRIINNGSVSAHTPRPNSIAYTASKHGVSGITKSIALDGRAYNIACGQIDIGNASTEMADSLGNATLQGPGHMSVEPRMSIEQVASTVVHMATLPPEANILFVTLMATKMPFVGRG